jgi:sugar lactone lactonase YvrE
MLNAATPLRPTIAGLDRKSLTLRLAAFSAALCGIANAHAGQLLVAAANSQGNATYELTRASSTTPLISGTLPINTDASKHGSFDSLVWVPNAATGTLDLIAADATRQQIVRYSGPNYGTATILYTWGGQGHGPAQPDGLSVDASGNLFVVSASCGLDSAALWVLPVNAAGGYGAPLLIDRHFGGAVTLKLAETVVANTATRLWNAGDLLVLVGDTLDARVMVYSHAAINGVLTSNPSQPLSGPTSTPIPWNEFAANIAIPTGMDVLPADATHAASLLITTIDGRILRFDTGSASFIAPFASGLGYGLQRIKVGSFADTPYTFVAQAQGNGGQILEFGAPPTSGANRPIAVLSKGVDSPDGLAVTASGSGPASSCVAPKTCDFLGGVLTHQISGPGAVNVGGQVLEQSCVVPADPRVTVNGSNWSCNGLQTLDVANYCPGFPHTIIPGSMCGHAGPSGAGFAIIKATADGVDPVDNDSFVKTQSSLNAILPGPLNLLCTQTAGPLLAWAPRSDLLGIEGTIVEDALSPFFVEMTGFCDDGGANLRGLSMYGLGLALNNTQNALPGGVTTYIDNKFTNVQSTVTAANINGGVAASLGACITQSKTDFDSGAAGAANGYSCAAYQLSQCDSYVRSNLGAFASNLHPNGGNPNPAGEIDGRLANLFLNINTRVAGNAANPSWPATNVPACVTLTAPATATTGSVATLSWTGYGVTGNSAPCALSSSDGHFNNTHEAANGSASTGTLAAGTHNYTLTCPGSGGSSGKATASIVVSAATPVVITSFTASPAPPGSVANGGAATLAWSVTGLPSGSYCTLSATDGTFLTTPNTHEGATGTNVSTGALTIPGTYTATLSCPGAATPKTASVTVQPAVLPVVINSFTATPGSVPNGAAASLTWSVSNLPTSASCTLSATDGTFLIPNTHEGATGTGVTTGALTIPGTYTATLSCPGAATAQMATVTVAAPAAPVISSFTASPTAVLYNASSNLTWTTTGVPANLNCTLSATDGTYATATSVASSGTVSTGALTATPTYTATLSCPGTGNTSAQKMVSFSVTIPNALNSPQGMAFGPNGNLYVANSGAGQVLVYAPSGGTLVQQPSLTLTGFADPVALAFDKQGNLYVADYGGDGVGSIVVYTQAGLANATPSTAAAIPASYASAVTVDNNGIVYVATNPDNGVITAYQYQPLANQPAMSNPQQLTYWYYDSVGYFNYLSALAFDGTHVLAVISGSEVEVYATGSATTAGSLLSTVPNDTLTPVNTITNGLSNPVAVAVDASANIYLAQSGSNTVNEYSQSGVLGGLTLSAIPNSGPPPSQYPALANPAGVAVDGAGLIYVANTPNNTIDVYSAAGVYLYEFLPLVSVGQPSLNADGISLTWTWTSLGEPATAKCSFTDTLNASSTTDPPSGSQMTSFPSGSYYDNATVTCPGATQGASLYYESE